MKDIKCPCGLRDYMDQDECKDTPCAVCCPLTCDLHIESEAEAVARLTNEEKYALARAFLGGDRT